MTHDSYQSPMISSELGSQPIESAADRNPYSRGMENAVLEDIEGVSVAELTEAFGSPVFVFSEAKILEKARRMRQAFDDRYDNISFVWSYKTNYLDAVCQILRNEGWGSEVVSNFEYEKAKNLGYKGPEIVFNGPYKVLAGLRLAIAEGALIQIDNWDELAQVEEIAEELGKPIDVGIRVWMATGYAPVWSKFGFAMINGEAKRAAERVIAHPLLNLNTIHTHIGTYILDPNTYRVAAQVLVGLREELESEFGHLVECLNFGGGFPSNSLLHTMVGPAESIVPPIESFAEAITSVLNRLPKEKRPLLRLETGRYLVDEAGYLVTKVVAIKGGERALAATSSLEAVAVKEQMLLGDAAKLSYVLDAGINILYTAAWFALNAYPARKIDTPPIPTRLLGRLCMAIDVIREQINLPRLQTGDHLTLHPVGAYNVTQAMQFISYRPAVALINTKGEPELIRQAERLKDIQQTEVMPPHLQRG